MAAQDFALDTDGDLYISDGDLAVALSDQYALRDIIQSFAGNWKEFPNLGVGVFAYVGSNGKEAELTRSIQQQVQSDGFINTETISANQLFDGNFKLTVNVTRGI
jgi:hypothetical protein